MKRLAIVLAALVAYLMTVPAVPGPQTHDALVYVGTYANGIYRLHLDTLTGSLTDPQLAASTSNPSFLAAGRHRDVLYVVNEDGETAADPRGAVSAYRVQLESGELIPMGSQPTHGAAPCHLMVDAQGRHLLVANYGSGSVSVLPIGPDGGLGAAEAVIQHEGHGIRPNQNGPHAHSVILDRRNRFAFVSDLGIDQVVAYRFDSMTGSLVPYPAGTSVFDPGSGPRHAAFDPQGNRVYVLTEMTSTVSVFDYDAHNGLLKRRGASSSLPTGFPGHSDAAEIAVRPDGRFVYASNRGADDIAIFAVEGGALRRLANEPTQGTTPRSFAIDPSGQFLLVANQGSGSVVTFRIDQKTGLLHSVGRPVLVPRPACVLILPPQ